MLGIFSSYNTHAVIESKQVHCLMELPQVSMQVGQCYCAYIKIVCGKCIVLASDGSRRSGEESSNSWCVCECVRSNDSNLSLSLPSP